jgi:S1-C subfamily serine protease
VAAGSAAAAGGLQPGDRIVAVNDEAVQRAGQVIRRVANHPPEKPLRLTLERAGRRRIVVLHLPAAPAASRGNADGENGATPGPRGPSP